MVYNNRSKVVVTYSHISNIKGGYDIQSQIKGRYDIQAQIEGGFDIKSQIKGGSISLTIQNVAQYQTQFFNTLFVANTENLVKLS